MRAWSSETCSPIRADATKKQCIEKANAPNAMQYFPSYAASSAPFWPGHAVAVSTGRFSEDTAACVSRSSSVFMNEFISRAGPAEL